MLLVGHAIKLLNKFQWAIDIFSDRSYLPISLRLFTSSVRFGKQKTFWIFEFCKRKCGFIKWCWKLCHFSENKMDVLYNLRYKKKSKTKIAFYVLKCLIYWIEQIKM